MDPDLSDRFPPDTQIEGMRTFVGHRFPLLKAAPLLKTHACHYEISSSGNFIVAQHPQITNLLIAGGGNAEGFKFGPVVGQYIAQRAMGDAGDPDFAKGFAIPEKDFEPPPPAPPQPAPTAKKPTDCPPRSLAQKGDNED